MNSTALAPLRMAVLGGAADDLAPFCRVLADLPSRPGFAVLLLVSPSPGGADGLEKALRRCCALPLEPVAHLRRIEPDRVYLLHQETGLLVLDGQFRLAPRLPEAPSALDLCLSSLAQEPDAEGAVALLSGPGRDGAAGVIDLKAAGGYVVVQAPETASHAERPRAVLDTALVDEVLPPERIAAALLRHFADKAPPSAGASSSAEVSAEHLNAALALVQQKTGLNLSYVKEVNLKRRFLRRVLMHEQRDPAAYLQRLRSEADEAPRLRDDILIGVTAFFRDADFVEVLRQTVIPQLLAMAQDSIRIWVPACSTGEEVYTIAILVREALEQQGLARRVQIFGTDINEGSIAVARAGRYGTEAVANVPEPLRTAAFVADAGGWSVSKDIRAMCIFAKHNLLNNAPFSGMSLVSCRNLLIYLRKEAQQHVFEMLHYALRPEGCLLLGRAEAASGELFQHAGAPHLYRKLLPLKRPRGPFAIDALPPWEVGPGAPGSRPRLVGEPLEDVANRVALERYVPAGFLVNESGEVVQFRGHVAPFMAPAGGDATLSLARLVRPELHVHLRTALLEAARCAAPVRRERIHLGGERLALEALPVAFGGEVRHFLLTLQSCRDEPGQPACASEGDAADAGRVEELERTVATLSEELESVRAQLKTLVSEFETANEELRTSNEEVLSANEELQSANEELQSAKQELESANQELGSLNDELHARNEQLALANDDLVNLVDGIPLPVLLLDRHRRVRMFSPQAALLFRLPRDCVGRPFASLNTRFPMAEIEELFQAAVRDLMPVEREIADAAGQWSLVSVRAYRTGDDRIDGGVITFQDIHRLKSALSAAQAACDEAQRATAAKDDFLALVSHELRAPLNAISGWSTVMRRTLQSGRADDALIERALSTVQRNCLAQAQLIDDLLDVSRISSGRLTLELRPVDLGALVRGVLEGLRPSAVAKEQVLLDTGLESELIVNGDARRLQQIATNLLVNAIKFTPKGGRIELSATRIGPWVELSVADNGIGISTELMPRLFDRFSQSDLSRTREYGGLGLGLSIVKHLVDGHGGSVKAISRGQGQGARLIVRLPASPLPVPPPLPLIAPPETLRRLQGVSVLLVDDEPQGREALEQILVLAGASVESVGSAAQGLAALECRSFDALVSDVAMPGMDGYDLVRALRCRERRDGHSPLYALALTGFASLRDRDAAIEAGFDDHVGKPVDAVLLVQRLAAALRSA